MPEQRIIRITWLRRGQPVVCWTSRHEPLPCQLRALEERLGRGFGLVMASGVFPSAEHLLELCRGLEASVIVPVLPLSLIARLVELANRAGITILYARMREVYRGSREGAEAAVAENPGCRTAVEYSGGLWRVWEFERFERILRIELVTEPW